MRDIFFEQIKDMNLELADNCPSPAQPVITLGEIPVAHLGTKVRAIASVKDEAEIKGFYSWKQKYKVMNSDGTFSMVDEETKAATAFLSADYPGEHNINVTCNTEFGMSWH